MRRLVFFLTTVYVLATMLVCGLACAAEGIDPDHDTEIPGPVPDDVKTETEIKIPLLPVVPVPVPDKDDADPVDPPKPDPVEPPKPTPVSVLAADHWYVIRSPNPFFVMDSRQGTVSLSDLEEGPLKLRGKFADGDGRIETRTYHDKFIMTVEAVTKGQVELHIIPSGATSAKAAVRQILNVMGQAPQPPPDPDVDPEPDVDPAPGPPGEIMVLMLYDQTGSRDQLNTVHSTSITEWLNKNCKTSADNRPEWRKWDRTSVSKPGMLDKETPAWQSLWKDLQAKLPQGQNVVVVRTEREFVIQTMAGPEDTLAFLTKVKGGK